MIKIFKKNLNIYHNNILTKKKGEILCLEKFVIIVEGKLMIL